MDAARFDLWTRAFGTGVSRRLTIIGGFLGLARAGGATAGPAPAPSCRPLGARCRKSRQCCASSCRGKKRKKRCRGAGCRVNPQVCEHNIRCQTMFGFVGECLPRLGGGVYCASGQTCSACTQDSDCVGLFGETAACIACPDACPQTGGRLCAGDAVD
jgi:hypothetical protein